jgi:hypothetical protein
MQVIKYIRSSYYEFSSWFIPKRFIIGTLVYLILMVVVFCQMPVYQDMTLSQHLYASAFYFSYDFVLLCLYADHIKVTLEKPIKIMARTMVVYQTILIIYDIILIFVDKQQFNEACHSQLLGLILSITILGIVFWNIIKLKVQ